jgi:type VI protein secretion system component Hcp
MDVTVGMEATQKLFDLAATGKPVAHVRFLIYKDAKDGGKIPLFSALLSDVSIVSLNWTGKGDKPAANVTLDYKSIEIVKNSKADAPGDLTTVTAGWNRVQNLSDLSGAM